MNTAREAWMPKPLPAALALPMQELLAKILGEARERPVKQLMIVGASGRVGTSFIAMHWAQQLASAFGTVLVVEIRNEVTDEQALDFAPSETPPGPVVCIQRSQRSVLEAVARGEAPLAHARQDAFGLVLWDVPPVTSAPVALVLARSVDNIVLVAQAHRTRRHVAIHSALRLKESGGRLLGVVLNRTLNFIPGWIYRLL
jgi:Mrp family chromosome partitioning ATPase